MSGAEAMQQEAFWVGVVFTIVALVVIAFVFYWGANLVEGIKQDAIRDYKAGKRKDTSHE